MNEEALVVAEQPPPASLFRTDDPSEVVMRATAVAASLRDVISKQGLISNISGKQYPKCEAWTLCGTMLGIFPVLVWTRPLEEGWEARVEARTRDGAIVGAAEAECLRTERNWANRDDFALRSMAQTRATAKALRMPLGFIMTLAGYEPTPSEEMPYNEPEAPKAVQTPSKQENAPKSQPEPQSVAIKHATETTRAWFINEFLNAKPNTNERLVCEAYFRALKWLGDDQPIDLLPLCYVPTSIGQARTILPYLGTFQQEGRAAEPWPAVNAPEPQKTGWRAHKVVWTKGKFANLPLGELPKDFLFQMWRTYEVKDTWEDKTGVHTKSEASMEKDKAFRTALDEAGKELNFREEPA